MEGHVFLISSERQLTIEAPGKVDFELLRKVLGMSSLRHLELSEKSGGILLVVKHVSQTVHCVTQAAEGVSTFRLLIDSGQLLRFATDHPLCLTVRFCVKTPNTVSFHCIFVMGWFRSLGLSTAVRRRHPTEGHFTKYNPGRCP